MCRRCHLIAYLGWLVLLAPMAPAQDEGTGPPVPSRRRHTSAVHLSSEATNYRKMVSRGELAELDGHIRKLSGSTRTLEIRIRHGRGMGNGGAIFDLSKAPQVYIIHFENAKIVPSADEADQAVDARDNLLLGSQVVAYCSRRAGSKDHYDAVYLIATGLDQFTGRRPDPKTGRPAQMKPTRKPPPSSSPEE